MTDVSIRTMLLEFVDSNGASHIREMHIEILRHKPDTPEHTIRARLCFLRGGQGKRNVSRPRPPHDVPHRGGREEDAQQLELVGDSNRAPTEVRLGDLPHE